MRTDLRRTWTGDLLKGPCSNTDEMRGDSDQDGSSGGMTAGMRERGVGDDSKIFGVGLFIPIKLDAKF